MSESEFMAKRLLSFCFALAFASTLAQAEMFSGSCGLNASTTMHLLCILCSLAGLGISMMRLLTRTGFESGNYLFGIMSFLYLVCCLVGYRELLLVDKLLIESGLYSSFRGLSESCLRFFISRALLGTWMAKLTTCGPAWLDFNYLKSDALNQPFPFTIVWHLAQLPGSVLRFLTALVFSSELILGMLVVLVGSTGPLLCVGVLSIYYMLMGNFGWAILVLVATIIRLLPPQLVRGVLGETFFQRCGYTKDDGLSPHVNIFCQPLRSTMKDFFSTGCLLFLIAFMVVFAPNVNRGVYSSLGLLSGVVAILVTVLRLRRSWMSLVLSVFGIVFSGTEFSSLISGGYLRGLEDFSAFPTCFTFPNGAHTDDARTVFLLQTKYSVLGTNTMGSNLGGTRYAELSVPGSVHGDEVRPPFLMGHVPRIALKLWRIGTGAPHEVTEGLSIMRKLEKMVESGSECMRVFFSNADEQLIEALIASKGNQVQSFAQTFKVTNRVADHQWWKRDYQGVSALPTGNLSGGSLPKSCSIVIPIKVLGSPIELILPSVIIGFLLVRLLLSSEKSRRKR
jgi:hypothetical protein